jgi:hypothetical protein
MAKAGNRVATAQAWQPRGDSAGIEAIGGRGDRIYGVGSGGIQRWSGSAWTMELASSALPATQYTTHSLSGVCTTDHHVLVLDMTGQVLVKPL